MSFLFSVLLSIIIYYLLYFSCRLCFHIVSTYLFWHCCYTDKPCSSGSQRILCKNGKFGCMELYSKIKNTDYECLSFAYQLLPIFGKSALWGRHLFPYWLWASKFVKCLTTFWEELGHLTALVKCGHDEQNSKQTT